MSYALILNDTITSVGGLPRAARRLDTQEWVLGLRDADIATQQACGYTAVVDTPRPADTATDTFDRSVELVDGVPTVVWTQRPKTQEELDADADEVERDVVRNLIPKMTAIIDGTTSDTVVRQRKDIARLLRRVARDSLGD